MAKFMVKMNIWILTFQFNICPSIGKYGYVDDTGKVREIEYGASRRGFEPAGK